MKAPCITLALIMSLSNYSRPIQTPTICYVYKIQYDGRKDSSRFLIKIQYLNKHMDITREIVISPDGHNKDTCETQLKYDLHGNKTSELTKCSGGKIVISIQRNFTYGQSGGIDQELSIQDHPYPECYRVTHKRDSVIKSKG